MYYICILRGSACSMPWGSMLPFVNKDTPMTAKTQSQLPTPVVCAYAGFTAVAFYVFHAVAEREASSVLTMSATSHVALTALCAVGAATWRSSFCINKSL